MFWNVNVENIFLFEILHVFVYCLQWSSKSEKTNLQLCFDQQVGNLSFNYFITHSMNSFVYVWTLDMDNHYHIVLDALTKASSQNAELLKIAERQLKSWETERGFYSILLVNK